MAESTDRSDQGGICLCVIFNHPYLANLPLLRRIYAGRFRHIRFLVPLVRVQDEDVITIYRGSFTHNAYAVDAWSRLRELACLHYVFVHDDLLLAPNLNEATLLLALGIEADDEGFMPQIQRAPSDIRVWGHLAGPLWRLMLPRNFLSGTGVDSIYTVTEQLPSLDVAMRKMGSFGCEKETVLRLSAPGGRHDHLQNFNYFGTRTREQDDAFREHYLRMLFDAPDGEGSRSVPYPLVVSGPTADFYLVPKVAMEEFVHYSGVLAAAGAFVEVAAPTALTLACGRVRTCADKLIKFEFAVTWRQPEEVIAEMTGDPALLGVHPVKLSMVKNIEAFLSELRLMRDLPLSSVAPRREMEPDFDAEAYLEANPDVRAAGVPAWAHYRHYGRREGRALRPPRAD